MKASNPTNSRGAFYALSWVVLMTALALPLPTSFAGAGQMSPLALFVFSRATEWYDVYPALPPGVHFAGLMLFVLSVFTHVVFLTTLFSRKRDLSPVYKVVVIGSLAINMSLVFFFPFFAGLVAYWLWLLAFAALAWTFMRTPGGQPLTQSNFTRKAKDGAMAGVPTLLWIWLAFTLFWIGVETMNQLRPAAASPAQATAPKDQALASYVNDEANILKPDDQVLFNALLENFEKVTSNQIVVATYPRLPATPLEEFTIRIAELSRLGRKGLDNGAILFVFVADRTARLEVGYGLEGALPDAIAHRILVEKLAPGFARGDAKGGIDATLAAMIDAVREAYLADRMPGKLALFYKQFKVAFATLFTLPMLLSFPLNARFVFGLVGGAVGLYMFYGFRMWWRMGRSIGIGTLNLFRRRKIDDGDNLKGVDGNQMFYAISLVGIPVIGILTFTVVIAGGGAFGGAGALIHW
jgi:uncharacterized membrane protein YgcG